MYFARTVATSVRSHYAFFGHEHDYSNLFQLIFNRAVASFQDFLERFGYLPIMKEGVQHDQAARTGAIR